MIQIAFDYHNATNVIHVVKPFLQVLCGGKMYREPRSQNDTSVHNTNIYNIMSTSHLRVGHWTPV